MIVIDIQNFEELAAKQKGRFKVFIGKWIGVDIRRKVEEIVAEQLKAELAKEGVQANVSVKQA